MNWLRAMIVCICYEHLPVCLLNDDGTRAARQPYVYGFDCSFEASD